MLDRLPIELLAYVLSFVDPPSPHHLDKSASLHACCLVSQRLKEVAQPLLWQTLVLANRREFEAFKREAERTGLGRHVRRAVVDGGLATMSRNEPVKNVMLGEVLQISVDIRNVNLKNFWFELSNTLDSIFPHLQYLHHISLVSVDFHPVEAPVTFAHLSSLLLWDVGLLKSFLETLLRPRYLPALHSLAMARLHERPEAFFVPTFPTLLMQQLDILQLSLYEVNLAEAAYFSFPNILFPGRKALLQDLLEDLAPEDLIPAVRNLHIGTSTFVENYMLRSRGQGQCPGQVAAARLTTSLPSMCLRVLILPYAFKHPRLAVEYGGLLQACSKQGIEILWEDDYEDETKEQGWISDEFRRWTRKQKKEAREAQIGRA